MWGLAFQVSGHQLACRSDNEGARLPVIKSINHDSEFPAYCDAYRQLVTVLSTAISPNYYFCLLPTSSPLSTAYYLFFAYCFCLLPIDSFCLLIPSAYCLLPFPTPAYFFKSLVNCQLPFAYLFNLAYFSLAYCHLPTAYFIPIAYFPTSTDLCLLLFALLPIFPLPEQKKEDHELDDYISYYL